MEADRQGGGRNGFFMPMSFMSHEAVAMEIRTRPISDRTERSDSLEFASLLGRLSYGADALFGDVVFPS
jgi:hypothetical protein